MEVRAPAPTPAGSLAAAPSPNLHGARSKSMVPRNVCGAQPGHAAPSQDTVLRPTKFEREVIHSANAILGGEFELSLGWDRIGYVGQGSIG